MKRDRQLSRVDRESLPRPVKLQRPSCDAFGVLFWSAVLLGSLIFTLPYYKRVPKRWVNPMARLAIALVSLPIFALSYLLYNSSQLVIFDQWSMFIATGFLVLWGLPTLVSTRRTRSVMSIFALAAISIGTWLLVGDFLFPRREAEGVVETMNKTRGIAPSYEVYIGGHRYNTTASLLDYSSSGHVYVSKLAQVRAPFFE